MKNNLLENNLARLEQMFNSQVNNFILRNCKIRVRYKTEIEDTDYIVDYAFINKLSMKDNCIRLEYFEQGLLYKQTFYLEHIKEILISNCFDYKISITKDNISIRYSINGEGI